MYSSIKLLNCSMMLKEVYVSIRTQAMQYVRDFGSIACRGLSRVGVKAGARTSVFSIWTFQLKRSWANHF